eukprot:m.48605 g.48605  ORF g.48605 m.48605 type:complete len:860 (+) comp7012_c1_seq1:42-2621(+)
MPRPQERVMKAIDCGVCDTTTPVEGDGLSVTFSVPRHAVPDVDVEGPPPLPPPLDGIGASSGGGKDAVTVSLNRPDASEPCGKALARAAKTVEKALARLQRKQHKDGKGKQQTGMPPISVVIRLRAAPRGHADSGVGGGDGGGSAVIDDAVPSGDAFVDGAVLEVDVGCRSESCHTRCVWTVRRDRPRVTSVVVPDLPLVGFPLVCVADTLYADSVEYVWTIAGVPTTSDAAVADACTATRDRGKEVAAAAAAAGGDGVRTTLAQQSTDAPPPLSTCAEYTPSDVCLGCRLAVTVTPVRADDGGSVDVRGDPVVAVCEHPVHTIHPDMLAPLDKRTGVPRPHGATLRVVTLNVQWGLGSAKDHGDKAPVGQSMGASVGAACAAPGGGGGGAEAARGTNGWVVRSAADLPVSLQTRHYRQHTLLRELLGWCADVVSLQEVTPPVHDTFLGPLLDNRGFGSVRAGELVLVWRRDRFDLVDERSWTVSELLDEAENRDILAAFQAVPHALKHFRSMPHQAQCAKLRPVGGGKRLVIINVHLVMDEYAEHLRAVQAALVLRRAHRWATALDDNGDGYHVVLAGDLNVRGPEAPFTEYIEAVMTLLCTGVVDADHPCFARGRGVGKPKPIGHRHSIPLRGVVSSVAPSADKDTSAHNDRCNGSTDGSDGQTPSGSQPPRCSIELSNAKGVELSCPNAATEAGGTCWDHACRFCGAVRHDYRLPVCRACWAAANASRGDDGVGWPLPLPPLPADIAADTLRCRLDTGGIVLDSARRALPRSDDGLGDHGSVHKFSFYSVPFHPPSGVDRPVPFVELRDHVMYTPSTLRPVRFALPPPATEFRGRLPGLAWPSDHLSVAVDFCELE